MMNKTHQASRLIFAIAFYLFLPLALSACLGLNNGEDLIPPEASGAPPSFIQVGTGTTPKYSWIVGNISSLFVVRVSDPRSPVWGVGSRGATDNIPSPVTHGQSLDDPNLRDIPNLQFISTTEPVPP